MSILEAILVVGFVNALLLALVGIEITSLNKPIDRLSGGVSLEKAVNDCSVEGKREEDKNDL